jgi:hypothetical protein
MDLCFRSEDLKDIYFYKYCETIMLEKNLGPLTVPGDKHPGGNSSGAECPQSNVPGCSGRHHSTVESSGIYFLSSQ